MHDFPSWYWWVHPPTQVHLSKDLLESAMDHLRNVLVDTHAATTWLAQWILLAQLDSSMAMQAALLIVPLRFVVSNVPTQLLYLETLNSPPHLDHNYVESDRDSPPTTWILRTADTRTHAHAQHLV